MQKYSSACLDIIYKGDWQCFCSPRPNHFSSFTILSLDQDVMVVDNRTTFVQVTICALRYRDRKRFSC